MGNITDESLIKHSQELRVFVDKVVDEMLGTTKYLVTEDQLINLMTFAFSESGEGGNGEYPYLNNTDKIKSDFTERFRSIIHNKL